jgi:hypothetical protein
MINGVGEAVIVLRAEWRVWQAAAGGRGSWTAWVRRVRKRQGAQCGCLRGDKAAAVSRMDMLAAGVEEDGTCSRPT